MHTTMAAARRAGARILRDQWGRPAIARDEVERHRLDVYSDRHWTPSGDRLPILPRQPAPPAARPVSQGELYGLKAQVRRLKANDARRDVEDAVARGEIRPGDREKMLRLAGWNPKLFRERLAEGRRAPAALVDRYAPRAGRIHPRDPKRAHALALAMAAKAATMKAKR